MNTYVLIFTWYLELNYVKRTALGWIYLDRVMTMITVMINFKRILAFANWFSLWAMFPPRLSKIQRQKHIHQPLVTLNSERTAFCMSGQWNQLLDFQVAPCVLFKMHQRRCSMSFSVTRSKCQMQCVLWHIWRVLVIFWKMFWKSAGAKLEPLKRN